MASVIVAAAQSFFEIDEVNATKRGDTIEYTFLTTGILPATAELKTKIWAYLSPPVKRLEIVSIDVIEKGPITKRFKIRVKGKTIAKTLGNKKYRLFNLKRTKPKKKSKRKRR